MKQVVLFIFLAHLIVIFIFSHLQFAGHFAGSGDDPNGCFRMQVSKLTCYPNKSRTILFVRKSQLDLRHIPKFFRTILMKIQQKGCGLFETGYVKFLWEVVSEKWAPKEGQVKPCWKLTVLFSHESLNSQQIQIYHWIQVLKIATIGKKLVG